MTNIFFIYIILTYSYRVLIIFCQKLNHLSFIFNLTLQSWMFGAYFWEPSWSTNTSTLPNFMFNHNATMPMEENSKSAFPWWQPISKRQLAFLWPVIDNLLWNNQFHNSNSSHHKRTERKEEEEETKTRRKEEKKDEEEFRERSLIVFIHNAFIQSTYFYNTCNQELTNYIS